jgi:hypothetical protein
MTGVEFDTRGRYDNERKRGNNRGLAAHNLSVCNKCTPPYNIAKGCKRRRAQNRAAQQAFRERKKVQMRELEERLAEIQKQYDVLADSYKSLQLEHTIVTQHLETFRRGHKNERVSHTTGGNQPGQGIWEDYYDKTLHPTQFGNSVFCLGQDEGWAAEDVNAWGQPLTLYPPPLFHDTVEAKSLAVNEGQRWH